MCTNLLTPAATPCVVNGAWRHWNAIFVERLQLLKHAAEWCHCVCYIYVSTGTSNCKDKRVMKLSSDKAFENQNNWVVSGVENTLGFLSVKNMHFTELWDQMWAPISRRESKERITDYLHHRYFAYRVKPHIHSIYFLIMIKWGLLPIQFCICISI